jgi:hypothetical protein
MSYRDRVKIAAQTAAFYVDATGTYRIMWHDEDEFCYEDEDTGEEYVVAYDDVPTDDVSFMQIVAMEF